MATTATQIINIVTLNKSTLHWMVSRIVQDSINFYYFWDEYYINAYGITEEKANEQLKGKELLDTLEALRTILHPTVRALLESYTIDMVMPIPGIISFLLIGKSKQEIEPGTIMFRIRYLMEGCIDHEPTSLLKEYHIHLNAQPKEGQENPSIIQISKKLTTITIK